ncbi:glycoside hydrolase family 97 protein [Nibrella viscosa]|uniref:Glycoside hydrolase family 97 protein n=2 Tax=Nibrella viscosa TaxID=1084524 RepID=A0ABP8KV18_9BACT
MNVLTFLGCWLIAFSVPAADRTFQLQSPNQQLHITVEVGNQVRYRVSHNGIDLLQPSTLSMTLADGRTLGRNSTFRKQTLASANRTVTPPYGISQTIPEQFNELRLDFRENFAIIFRAYNEGVAYRFATNLRDSIRVQNEEVQYRLAGDWPAYFHPSEFLSSFESNYVYKPLSQQTQQSSLPILAEVPNGVRLAFLESDLLDYPGLYLKRDSTQTSTLMGLLPAYPKVVEQGGHSKFNMLVREREPYLAQTIGMRAFPWRVMAVAQTDKDLLNNQLVYLLASENKLGDVSWVKPGKVAWDWWSANNLTGVPFKAGFNTETYKYFIDFAARNGIEYVNLDEGWSDQFDLLKPANKLDMDEVVRYARQKNVGLILWCVWHTLDRQMQPALDQFAKWGIAGVKVDFMDRDDQVVVNFYERLLREAAKRKMLVNYHGAYKPTGLQRTFPNNINRESVKGLEWNKFNPQGITPEHDVTLPFIRMLAGSMDYTPGAMTNMNKENWRMIFEQPMSQGTRAHQLAMFVVYHAPLQMLADAPTAYEREPDVLKFLAAVPVTWDETVPLDSKVADYVTIARRKGDAWYVGSMTDWTARDLSLKLDFLGDGTYQIEVFRDGPNAERVGSDYVREVKTVRKGETVAIPMAAGGGWVARFTK